MNIFIDESGPFVWSHTLLSRVSCLGALIIPSFNWEAIEEEILRLPWKTKDAELKGSELDENKIIDVLKILGRFEAIFRVCSVDMEIHKDIYVTRLKNEQANGLTANLTSEHKPKLVAEMYGYSNEMQGMSNQLFIQGILFINLVRDVLEVAPNYWALRNQDEIREFRWTMDAKNSRGITASEKLWDKLLLPLLLNGERVMSIWPGVDYSGLSRFRGKVISEAPNFEIIPEDKRPDGWNFQMITKEYFLIEDSRSNLGLQLVDVVTNAFRRALNGNLNKSVFSTLGSLLINQNENTLKMATFTTIPQSEVPRTAPYGIALNAIVKTSRSALTEKYTHWLIEQRRQGQ